VQVRNQLLKTVALTGCVCFSLVALAVLTEVAFIHLAMGIAFFLVGAIVGLFNQLRLDASAETATEDYGLATARLVHTPLFSGLAALVGVLVIPLLSLLANGVAAKESTPLPSLGDLFGPSPVSFLLAVVFGLSPTVLLNRLQKEAEQYKADLKSSESLSQEGGRGSRSSITRPSTFTVQPQSSVTAGLHPNGAPDAPVAPIVPSNN
jgi:hypothetical protein